MNAVRHILTHCGSLKQGERAIILCDETTKVLSESFLCEAKMLTKDSYLHQLPLAETHGEEPPKQVAERMGESDLIVCLTQFSLAHSQARVLASRKGARFLSLPLYTEELLSDPCLTFDYRSQEPLVRAVADAFTMGEQACIKATAGTDLCIEFGDRVGNCCPGFVDGSGDLGSPPDIEANVSPIEDASEGVICIDGSITCPEIGLLSTPVMLDIEKGRIVNFRSENKGYLKTLEAMFGDLNSPRRVLAECGVGLNPMAKLTGTMLTDEGAMGCIHFGFGSNYTVGGKNKVDFHLDFVLKEASLHIDQQEIMCGGKISKAFFSEF
jgi:leucyl aminopeptidase (aminopeptidase T)